MPAGRIFLKIYLYGTEEKKSFSLAVSQLTGNKDQQ